MKNFILYIIISLIPCVAMAKKSDKHISLLQSEKRNLKKINTNNLLKRHLELSAFRHKILAKNISNANTPGYKAQEVDVINQLNKDLNQKNNRRISLRVTSSKHIVKNNIRNTKLLSHSLKNPYEVKKNGNNVSLAQQMTKLSQNKNDYNLSVKTYATLNSLFSTIIGK